MSEINLEMGENYQVQIYPTEEIVEAKYNGELEKFYLFENNNFFFPVNKGFITKEKGLITHLDMCSISIPKIEKNELNDNFFK